MIEKIIEVVSAIYIDEYKIKITFQDGMEQLVDFRFFLEKSLNPSIKHYLDLKFFKAFTIKNGQLMWGDYDLIFPTIDLYNNSL